MTSHASTALIASLTVALAACGKKSEEPRPAPAATAAAAPTAPAPATAAPAPAKAARDLTAIDTCRLIKADEVAKIAGGKLLGEPSATGPACLYTLELGGDTVLYKIAFSEPAMLEALLQVQTGADKGEKVDGSWDEAYLQPQPAGPGLAVLALWRGDVALEVAGDRKEPVVELARLAASRLP